MGARVAQREVAERIAHRLEQRFGDAGGQRHAERVADSAAASSTAMTRGSPAMRTARTRRAAASASTLAATSTLIDRARDLRGRQIAERQQHVVDAVGALHAGTGGSSRWSCRSIASIGVGVEQLAQLRVAEQLAQLRLVDGQRLGAALGQRRVAVVDEARRRS